MFRVQTYIIAATALPIVIAGCTRNEVAPAPSVVTKTIVRVVEKEKPGPAACPSDEEIAEAIYAASKRIYLQKAELDGRTGACACDGDTYGAAKIVCGSPSAGAIQVATWGFCKKGKPIPGAVMDEARSK